MRKSRKYCDTAVRCRTEAQRMLCSKIGMSPRAPGHSKLGCARRELDVRYKAHLTVGWGRHVQDDQLDDHSQKCGKEGSGVDLHSGQVSLQLRARPTKPTQGRADYGPISSTGRGDILG